MEQEKQTWKYKKHKNFAKYALFNMGELLFTFVLCHTDTSLKLFILNAALKLETWKFVMDHKWLTIRQIGRQTYFIDPDHRQI